MNRRTFLVGTAGLGAAVGLAGCTQSDDGNASASEEFDVGMGSAFFRPSELTVQTGETVVWRNTGNRRHTVTAYEGQIPDEASYFASGGFDSEEAAREGWIDDLSGHLDAGDTFEHTFEVPGEYHYFCVPHEPTGMVGKVVVEE